MSLRAALLLLVLALAPICARAQLDQWPPTSVTLGAINTVTAPNPSLISSTFCIGVGACSALPSTATSLIAVGPYTLHYATGLLLEDVALGSSACLSITTGFFDTCIGVSAGSAEVTANDFTAVGNDAMRDTFGASLSTGVGNGAYRSGGGNFITAFGAEALQGNSASIVLSGTKTTGDAICINFTSTNPNVVNVPISACYTVQSSDTLSTIAVALSQAVDNLNPGITLVDAQGTNWGTNYARYVNAFISPVRNSGPPAIGLHWPGSTATLWDIGVATSCTGTCTETLTVGPGLTGNYNVAIGAQALYGDTLTTGHDNIALGYSTMPDLTTGNSNVAIGSQAGFAMTTDYDNVFIGSLAGYAAQGTNQNIGIGWEALIGLTTGNNNISIGGINANQNAITTGNGNIQIGYGVSVPSPTASWQMVIGNFLYGLG